MLLAQALTRLLSLWDACVLDSVFGGLINDRIPIILIQILIRTLRDLELPQPSEATAYAVLTLSRLSSLPWLSPLILTLHNNWKRPENCPRCYEYFHRARLFLDRKGHIQLVHPT